MTIKRRFKVMSKQLILLVLELLLLVTGNLVPQAVGFLFYFYSEQIRMSITRSRLFQRILFPLWAWRASFYFVWVGILVSFSDLRWPTWFKHFVAGASLLVIELVFCLCFKAFCVSKPVPLPSRGILAVGTWISCCLPWLFTISVAQRPLGSVRSHQLCRIWK